MARAILSASLVLALALVVSQASGDTDPGRQPEELRFNGNTGDNTNPNLVTPNQQRQPQPQSQTSDDEDSEINGEPQQQQNQFPLFRPFRPFDSGLLAPFGDSRPDNFRSPLSPIFDNLFGNINRHADFINRQFSRMDRLARDGQEMTCYVRTCTTKERADRNQLRPSNLSPFDRSNSQREQQREQAPVKPEQLPVSPVSPASPEPLEKSIDQQQKQQPTV